METPLQFLRDFLPFGRAPAGGKAVAEVRQWLDSTADAPVLPALKALGSEIIPSIAHQPSLHMRFRLLEEARARVDDTLPAVEQQLEEAPLPLPLDVATAALAADNLLKSLAQAYVGITQGIGAQGLKAEPLLENAIRRAMQILARRQRLAYRAYATPSASSWQLLHDLYRLARSRGINGRNGAEPPIDYVYAGALLVAYVDPSKFPRGGLDQIRGCTDQLATLAIIAEATPETRTAHSPVGQFVVPGGDGTPGRPLARVATAPTLLHSLVVDYRPALAVLDRQLRKLPSEAPTFSFAAPETVLRALRVAIGGHAARRFPRTRFKPRADLVAGIDNLIALINGRALARSGGEAPRRDQPWPLPASEWALLDESPDGFGVRFVQGDTTGIEAGEAVGLLPRENSQLHLCLVRRIANTQHNRLELGLQEVSARPLVIDLAPGRQCILLPNLPAHGNCPGILAKPGQLQSGQRVTFRDPARAVRYRVDRRLEATPHLELFALEWLEME